MTDKVFEFKCDCNYIGLHSVKAQVDGEHIYIYTSMNHWLPWYKRLGVAIKYILGIDNTYCDYHETVLEYNEFFKIVDEIKREAGKNE